MTIDDLIDALENEDKFPNPILHKLKEEVIRHNYFIFIVETCLELAKNELETLEARGKEIKIMEGEVYPSSKYFPEFMDTIIKADNLRVLIEKLEEGLEKGHL
ncbi:hypothetical protein [Rufibacter aurantiacus]|uniref:hypothetical protein n=1 Tax=Rufibacter aurantiacus TaxID=2817374 RepID=UPI001B301940|nr:hypothetical protein [Rufibacter aurantiacus]